MDDHHFSYITNMKHKNSAGTPIKGNKGSGSCGHDLGTESRQPALQLISDLDFKIMQICILIFLSFVLD
jgi:hypothetical protein